MTHLDSLHESLLYLLHDSYGLWLIVAIISNRLLYIRGLSLVDFSPVWPHFYTVPLAPIHLCSLPYIRSQGLKDSLVLFVYWISSPSTERECKLENTITISCSMLSKITKAKNGDWDGYFIWWHQWINMHTLPKRFNNFI